MGVTTYTNCLKIVRKDGVVLRITELDKDLIVDEAQLGFDDIENREVILTDTVTNVRHTDYWFDQPSLDSSDFDYTGYYLEFTDGDNIGVLKLITSHSGISIHVGYNTASNLPYDISNGDGFKIYNFKETYISAAGYTATNMQSTSDNAVNNADVEGVLTAAGVNRADIIGGRYDFAKLYIFIYNYETDTLIKKLGTGNWGECTLQNGSYVAEYRSLSQQLQQTIGRTYNPDCDEQLGGTRCTVDLANYTYSGTINAVTDNANFTIDAGRGDGDLNYGKLTFTSGLNDGLYMEVKSNVGDIIELQLPIPFNIEVGDTYSVYSGCNKLLETCKTKFSNHINFQGFPYIPGQDAITRFGGQ